MRARIWPGVGEDCRDSETAVAIETRIMLARKAVRPYRMGPPLERHVVQSFASVDFHGGFQSCDCRKNRNGRASPNFSGGSTFGTVGGIQTDPQFAGLVARVGTNYKGLRWAGRDRRRPRCPVRQPKRNSEQQQPDNASLQHDQALPISAGSYLSQTPPHNARPVNCVWITAELF